VEPPILPGQNDAFYLGFISRMLIQGTQNAWDATQVLFRVADPDCIPQISAGLRIATGDNRGIKVTFPATWLLEPFERSTYQVSVTGKSLQHPPGSLVDSVRAALMPHMHDPDLTVAKAGTTISKEIAKLRANKAEKDLAGTNRRVAEIAQTVGFTDATVFSRAFKNWTGKSPQEYRRTHRSPNR
jgi:hypothetical protein